MAARRRAAARPARGARRLASATSSGTPPTSSASSRRCTSGSSTSSRASRRAWTATRSASTATIAHRAVVRYDAYNELSGRQSTSIALLDAHRSGIVLSSIHHREQARLYVKQVQEGVSVVPLSPEEQEAVRAALAGEVPDARRGRRLMRIGYLGPAGTFSEEALRTDPRLPAGAELVPLPTVHRVVVAVAEGEVDRALAPIENSLEGSVNEAIDALVHDAPQACGSSASACCRSATACSRDPGRALQDVRVVLSHPQAAGAVRALAARRAAGAPRCARGRRPPRRCARSPRARTTRSPRSARRPPASSTAPSCWPRSSATRPNATRFVWLAPAGRAGRRPRRRRPVEELARLLRRRRRRARVARALPVGVRRARREPHADRVAALAPAARALRVLARPRRPRGRPGRRPRRRWPRCGRSARTCGSSAPTRVRPTRQRREPAVHRLTRRYTARQITDGNADSTSSTRVRGG